jgi:hypothetical protein
LQALAPEDALSAEETAFVNMLNEVSLQLSAIVEYNISQF